jgi:adenylate cyclase
MPAARRLGAILAADVAGYSRLMGADEEGTHERLKAHLRKLIEPKIAETGAGSLRTRATAFLPSSPSVVDAARCAVEVQRGMAGRNAGVPPEEWIEFRVGMRTLGHHWEVAMNTIQGPSGT